MPNALPLIFSGVRSSFLQVIATATITAYVSLGGLGRYLFDGLAQQDYPQMAAGAVLVALLAMLIDLVLAVIQRYAVSPGITGRYSEAAGRAGPDGRPAGAAVPEPAPTARRHQSAASRSHRANLFDRTPPQTRRVTRRIHEIRSTATRRGCHRAGAGPHRLWRLVRSAEQHHGHHLVDLVDVSASAPAAAPPRPTPPRAPPSRVRRAADTIVIGSANFQENVVLANIYAGALKAKGVKVSTKLNIGSRETYYRGLQDGSIDLIPEYSGVLLQYFDKDATAVSSDDVYAALQKARRSR